MSSNFHTIFSEFQGAGRRGGGRGPEIRAGRALQLAVDLELDEMRLGGAGQILNARLG
jgi:hypothetical protein